MAERSEPAFMVGRGFYLRELRLEDLEGPWYSWFNDPEVNRWRTKRSLPNTREKQRTYYQMLQSSDNDVVFAIVESDGHHHIGNVGLHLIDWVNRSAELGLVIGEKEYWARGIGTQCASLISGYGFDSLNLHRVSTWILTENEASRRGAEKAGFRCEGTVRDCFYKSGRYHEAHYMNLLRSDLITP